MAAICGRHRYDECVYQGRIFVSIRLPATPFRGRKRRRRLRCAQDGWPGRHTGPPLQTEHVRPTRMAPVCNRSRAGFVKVVRGLSAPGDGGVGAINCSVRTKFGRTGSAGRGLPARSPTSPRPRGLPGEQRMGRGGPRRGWCAGSCSCRPSVVPALLTMSA